ncbi:MAG: PAS domain-containing protein, partial [Gammaproteobacteria bacterium]
MSEARIAERLHDEFVRMQSLFDAIPTALAVIDATRRCRYVNRAFADGVGLEPAACRDRFVGDLLPAAVCATLEPVLAAALEGTPDEALHADDGGNSQALHLRCRPWRDEQGAVLAVLALEGELPATRVAPPALASDLLALVDRLPVFIGYYGRDHCYHFVNARYEQWFRRPRAWFIGRSIASVIGAEAYAVVRHRVDCALAGKAVDFEFERDEPYTGRRRVLRASLVPDRRGDGEVPGAFALLEDVTEQRSAERAANQARWEKEAIADHLPALVAYVDSDLRYRYVNQRFRDWYGLPTSWFVGRRVEDVVGAETFAITGKLMRRALAGEELAFDYPRRNLLFAEPERTLRVQLVPDNSDAEPRGFIALMQDVTEEIAAARALRRAEQDIRALIDNMPALVAACDAQLRLVYGNGALAEWLDMPAAALAGRPALELVPEELHAQVSGEIERVLRGETVVVSEPRRVRRPATGAVGYYVGTYLPLLDGDSQRGFMVMINDVTESVLAMRAVREQQALLRQVTEGSSQGFVLSNLERSEIYYASAGIRRLWPRDVDARSWLEAVHPDDRVAVRAALAGVASSGGFAIEYRVVGDDGSIRWLNDKADVVVMTDGSPARLTSVFSDVTERVRQDERLEINRRRLERAQAAGQLGLWELDLQSGALYWSEHMRAMLEIPPHLNTPTSDSYLALVHADDRDYVEQRVEQALSGEADYDVEHRVVLPSGRECHVQSQASVERDAAGQPLRMVGLVRDITAQKHAEARLRQSEATLRNITETIDDVFWLIEIGHPESMYVSPGFAKLYGRPCASRAADAAGWLVSVHADDRERMARLFGRLARGEGYAAEYRILRPDGTERWVMERARRVATGEDDVILIAGLTTDITERKLQEAALGEYARRLAEAQDVGGAAFWQFELDSRRVTWSGDVIRMLGLGDERDFSVPLERVLETIHPDDRAMVSSAVRAAIEDDHPLRLEHRVMLPSGEVRYLHERGRIERDADGSAVRLLGIVQDITERKQAELALAASEQTLRQITENTRDVFWLMDATNAEVLYIGPGFARVWGEPADAGNDGAPWLRGLVEEDRERIRPLRARMLASGNFDASYRIMRRDGELRWIHTRAFPIRDADGRLERIAGFAEDVTDARRVAELKRLKEEADDASRTKTEFLSRMSHELRTPLNAVLGFAQLLLHAHQAPLGGEQRENVTEILNAGRHLLAIVDEMLDLTRIELGKLRIEPAPMALGRIVAECVSMVQSQAQVREITIDRRQMLDGDDRVFADRTRVRQILL